MTSGIIGLVIIAIAYLAGRYFLHQIVGNRTNINVIAVVGYTFCGAGIGILIDGVVKVFWLIPNNITIPVSGAIVMLIGSIVMFGGIGMAIALMKPNSLAPLSPTTQEQFAQATAAPPETLRRNQGIALLGIGILFAVLDYFNALQVIETQFSGGLIVLRVLYIFAMIEGLFLLFRKPKNSALL